MVNSEQLLKALMNGNGRLESAAEAEAVCRLVEAEMNFAIVCTQLKIDQLERPAPSGSPDLKLVN